MPKSNSRKTKQKEATKRPKYAAPLTTFASSDFDEVHEIDEEKFVRISLHLIAKRHLPSDSKEWPHDKILDELNKISHVRLDRERINVLELELLGPKVTNLYLQQNLIQEIEGLECLRNLKFLTMANNNISRIQGLTTLSKLAFLDLSENKIETFDIDELPASLLILNLKGNPCTDIPDYRGRIIQDLAELRMLDGETVTKTERLEAGFKVSSDEEDNEEEENQLEDAEEEAADAEQRIKDLSLKTAAGENEHLECLANGILLRSQNRLEEHHHEHKRRLQELDKYREDNALYLSPRLDNPVS